MKVKGEIHYLYIYDVGDEIELSKVEKVMNRLTQIVGLTYTRLTPKYITIKPAPLLVNLGTRNMEFFGKEKQVSVVIKIYEVGVISITLVVPVEEEFEDLIKYTTPKVKYRNKEVSLRNFSEEIVEKVVESIKDHIYGIRASSIPGEYTTFCINFIETKQTMDKFVSENKKIIAGILKNEPNVKIISDDEIQSALKYRISYYEDDIVLVDWSVALIIDPEGEFSDQLLTIELANLQLLELRAYDSLIDSVIEKAYNDIKKTGLGSIIFGISTKTAMEIAKKRLEIEEVIETTKNSVKFFGDWYVGKIYSSISERLHLKEWDNIVSEKLKTLEEIYQLAYNQIENRRMVFLELLIVILILIEIIIFLPH
jgi:anti-anti-sigma regulatory factor